MTFLPIVERELRVASRRRMTYWSRVGSSLLALIVCTYIYAMVRKVHPEQLGILMFSALSWLCFLYALLSGVRLTADCVSEEKREGTLGLLFLTDLKGYDVALGKLAACSLNSVYGLLAIFPVLGLSLLLGGVSARQFGSVVLVLVNTSFFSLALGLFVSTLCRNARKATGATLFLLLLIAAGPPGFAAAWAEAHDWPRPMLEMMYPSPGYALGLSVMQMFVPVPTQGFWISVLCATVMGLGCLFLSSLALPRVWQDKPRTPLGLRVREMWQQWGYGNARQRAAFRGRLLDINPFFWLAARDRLQPAYVWAVLGLLGALWLYGCLYYPPIFRDAGMYGLSSVLLHGMLKFWLSAAVVQRLGEDRRSSALELLLSTPLTTTEIFRGQLRALRRQFLGPIVVVLMADFAFCYAALREVYSERGLIVGLYGAHMAILVADAYTIGWVGMWVAVTAKHPNQAAAATLGRVLVIPWGAFIGVGTLIQVLQLDRRWNFNVSESAALGFWFALGLVNDLVFLLHATLKLQTEFRAVATQRFEPRRTGWAAWLSGGR